MIFPDLVKDISPERGAFQAVTWLVWPRVSSSMTSDLAGTEEDTSLVPGLRMLLSNSGIL